MLGLGVWVKSGGGELRMLMRDQSFFFFFFLNNLKVIKFRRVFQAETTRGIRVGRDPSRVDQVEFQVQAQM